MWFISSCAVLKATAHVGTKTLNKGHQAQKVFYSIFVGIPQHKKGYIVYVPKKRNIVSSYGIVFYESFSSALVYISQPYEEAMDILPSVSYINYYIYSRVQTVDIITFTQFEEGNLLSETCSDTKMCNESDEN